MPAHSIIVGLGFFACSVAIWRVADVLEEALSGGYEIEIMPPLSVRHKANEQKRPPLQRPGKTRQKKSGRRTHMVGHGETLFSIAQSEEVDIYRLAAANGLDVPERNPVIQWGQTLVLPK